MHLPLSEVNWQLGGNVEEEEANVVDVEVTVVSEGLPLEVNVPEVVDPFPAKSLVEADPDSPFEVNWLEVEEVEENVWEPVGVEVTTVGLLFTETWELFTVVIVTVFPDWLGLMIEEPVCPAATVLVVVETDITPWKLHCPLLKANPSLQNRQLPEAE